jgi:DNA primase
MISITEFYNKVLPSKGVYCIITIEPKEGTTKHYYVETIAELEPQIEIHKQSRVNIYVSHSTYKGWKRGKQEAVYSRSLFIDLDVDPSDTEGKKYTSKEEAENALNSFLAKTGLPEPIKFDSGRGMWAWWAFDRDIEIEQWKLYSETFKKFCLDNELKIDVNVTADAARATRTPNCMNWKADPPAMAQVLSEELPTYVFDEFKEFLDGISPFDLSI